MAPKTAVGYAMRSNKYLKILGFAPITIVDGKSVTKPMDFILQVLCASVGILISYIVLVQRHKLGTSKSEIANLGNFIIFMASIWISILSMILSFIFRHRVWALFLKVNDVETKVKLFTK